MAPVDAFRETVPGKEADAVSTFFVLPPRRFLGEHFAGFLESLFPGLGWGRVSWGDLGELLAEAAARHPDVYLVQREELPQSADLGQVLADGYGAELGDEVVEVGIGPRAGQTTARRWRVERV
jgi:hypothetical protein